MFSHWYVLDVNPDPWAIGPLGIGKRNGKFFPYVGRNTQLAAYKEAVAEILLAEEMLIEGYYKLTFYFWRRLDAHASGRKHIADATNLQKATEDALQGVLFDNDRQVRDVRSVVVEQGPDVRPCVVIKAENWIGFSYEELPEWAISKMVRLDEQTQSSNNEWSGPQ